MSPQFLRQQELSGVFLVGACAAWLFVQADFLPLLEV